MRPTTRLRPAVALMACSVLIAGCAAETLPASPSTGIRASETPSSASVAPSPSMTAKPSPTPTTVPAPTPTATPIPAAPSFPAEALAIPATSEGWRPVPDQKDVRRDQFQDVVWTGSRFVAVGLATFVDSTDGITWHRQTSPKRWSPVALAAGPGGVVAIGMIGTNLASWHSADGLTWTAARDAFPGVANSVADVVATPDGWLAVGAKLADICFGECEALRAFSWTSPDGLHWTRSPKQRTLDKAAFTSVTTAGDRVVAGGRKGWRGAIWTSSDGRTWKRAADGAVNRASPNGLQPGIFGMAANQDVVVAVGADIAQDVGGHVRAWWSATGETWTAAKVARSLNGQMFNVAATPRGFLAVGPSGGRCAGGIWDSSDGRTWRCIANDRAIKDFLPTAVAFSDTVEVAVGLTDDGYDEESGEGMPGDIWWRQRP